jgi:two-component system, OmpR family, response regulator
MRETETRQIYDGADRNGYMTVRNGRNQPRATRRIGSAYGASREALGTRPGCAPYATRRILLIDDEPWLGPLVRRSLGSDEYAVDAVGAATDGIQLASCGSYDLILFELRLPDMDGCEALTSILHSEPGQPLVVLSWIADTSVKVWCLDRGALDYLTKPFDPDELAARVRARLREARCIPRMTKGGKLVLDAGRLAARTDRGPVTLTRVEFLLLRTLMEHAGQSVAKSELLATVWGMDFDPGTNVIDVAIGRLRAKLGFTVIATVRGQGYRLAC